MTPLLHIPIDFERREDVRLFKRVVAQKNESGHGVLGLTYLFRMWVDWATAGVEFRKFFEAECLVAVSQIEWKSHELTFVIEDFCGWVGEPGALITMALTAGVMRLEFREGWCGLVLNDFWNSNCHFSKQYKTMQQKGAMAKAARHAADETRSAANHQVDLIQGQGKQFALPLDANINREQIQKCVALIMMMDRACEKPLRKRSEYIENETLMLSALQVVRRYAQGEIQKVYQYIIANRDNPRLGKIPERILEQFGKHLDQVTNENRVAAYNRVAV